MTDMMIDNFYHTIKKCPSLSYSFGVYNYEVELLRQRVTAARREKQWRSGNNKEHPKKKIVLHFGKNK